MKQLPFLPGVLHREDVMTTRRNFRRNHVFDVSQDGIRLTDINRSDNPASLTPSTHGRWNGQNIHNRCANGTFRAVHPDAVRAFLQERDQLEMKRTSEIHKEEYGILKFDLFFEEKVLNSRDEKSRIRECSLYWHTDDNSQLINEPKIVNSGISQGVLMRRHTVPGLHLEDLVVGDRIKIYGRIYNIVGCSPNTRNYFRDHMNLIQPEPIPTPTDAFANKNQADPNVRFNKDMNPDKAFVEARLGRSMAKPRGHSFLAQGLKIFKFYAIWNDESIYGEPRPFEILFFLEDSSVQVSEHHAANCGRFPFPAFLKRGRLPKNPKNYTENFLSVAKIGWGSGVDTEDIADGSWNNRTFRNDWQEDYYELEDFKIGAEINVFNRKLKIIDCDHATRVALKMPPPIVNNLAKEPALPQMVPPEYNGIGVEEDSLGSFLKLRPSLPIMVDYQKYMELDGQELAWLAEFVNPESYDKERKFVIKYYLDIDKISVFEKFQHNSGFVGGMWLSKTRMINPDTKEFYHYNDFKKGTIVTINSYKFKILTDAKWSRK